MKKLSVKEHLCVVLMTIEVIMVYYLPILKEKQPNIGPIIHRERSVYDLVKWCYFNNYVQVQKEP